MTLDALTRALAFPDQSRDADGLARSNDPRGMMVGADELANRRKLEGGDSLIMCVGCGYGLAHNDTRCPKCGSGSTEIATAFVPRDHLPDLLAGHQEAEPQLSGQRAGHKSGMASAAKRAGKPRVLPDLKRKHQKKETEWPKPTP